MLRSTLVARSTTLWTKDASCFPQSLPSQEYAGSREWLKLTFVGEVSTIDDRFPEGRHHFMENGEGTKLWFWPNGCAGVGDLPGLTRRDSQFRRRWIFSLGDAFQSCFQLMLCDVSSMWSSTVEVRRQRLG